MKLDKAQIINGGQTCKTIFQTIDENPDSDFKNVEVLVRIYEVNNDERVIQDITLATNSKNPVDFRDLKSNEPEQKDLELGAKQLGYIYRRKRDSQSGKQNGLDVIPSSVAAEAVFAIWREQPHLAKQRKHEFFNIYYDTIFSNLNAAQMIIAVLIFRYCDNNRKKFSNDPEIQAYRKFSQYFMAMLMGKRITYDLNITLEQLTHRNFLLVRDMFEEKKEELYNLCEAFLRKCMHESLSYISESLNLIDGRTIAAVFRRFDIIEKYLKTPPKLFLS